jgi:uncharacterized protein YndB with AHSA1/START domain
MKAIIGTVVVILLLVLGYVGWQYYRIQQAVSGPAAEMLPGTEKMIKSGDTWDVSFMSKFDAPVDKVYEAFTHPERFHEFAPDNILEATVTKEEGNVKVVEIRGRLDILPPGFKIQQVVTEYTFFPAEHRISSRTVGLKIADINSNFLFEPTPDGKTLLRFTQTSKDKSPLPDAVQKGALREQYIVAVRAVNRALGLVAGEPRRQAS